MNLIEALQAVKEGKKVKLISEKNYLEMCPNGLVKIKSLKNEEIGYWGLYNANLKANDFELYEEPKPILDAEEKAYLENFLRPFKNKVEYIEKRSKEYCNDNNCIVTEEYLMISITNDAIIYLPNFEENSMYKGMKSFNQYTLNELGLFKNE